MSKEKPKIVLMMSNFNYGGAEKQWAQYLAQLPPDAPFEVEIITFLPNSPISLEHLFDRALTVTLIDYSSMSFPKFFLKLVMTLRRIQPKIVHTILTGSVDTWGRLAAWMAQVPIIIHSELSLGYFGASRKHLLLRPFLDRVTDRFLPNSHAMAQWLANNGVPKGKICYVPNPIDLDIFRPGAAPSLRAELGVPDTAVVAGFLATFRPVKRLDILLDAIEALPESDMPDFFLFGGDGEAMPMVKARLEANNLLKQKVKLLGLVRDTPRFFESIDYFILTSDIEGMPNVVLESLAMEKPVIASDIADLARILKGAGLLAKAGDAKSFAEQIRVMQHLTLEQRTTLGKVGRKHIENEFAISVASRHFWQAHQTLLDALPKAS
jgi:glycosyltransferase involved in cell wall biosynthesis